MGCCPQSDTCCNHHILSHWLMEHDYQVGRPIVEIMRILGHSLLVKADINKLLKPSVLEFEGADDRLLYFYFKFD